MQSRRGKRHRPHLLQLPLTTRGKVNQMKHQFNICGISIAAALAMVMSVALSATSYASSNLHLRSNYNFVQSHTDTKNKSCGTLFNKAKRKARDRAKRLCRINEGSGNNALSTATVIKMTCNKNQRTASVRIYYNCR